MGNICSHLMIYGDAATCRYLRAFQECDIGSDPSGDDRHVGQNTCAISKSKGQSVFLIRDGSCLLPKQKF